MTERETIIEMRDILTEVRGIGPCLDGNLLANKSNRYTKKNGSVSVYPAPPVLQYRVGPGKRRSKRIPAGKVAEIGRLIEAGRRAGRGSGRPPKAGGWERTGASPARAGRRTPSRSRRNSACWTA